MSRERGFSPAVSIRHAAVWIACLAAPFGAADAARAARVVDVRIGLHADHTRVVIELDAPSGHRTERVAGSDATLAVRLDARGERRRVLSRSPLVEGVTVEPGADGAVARIALRGSGLDYSEMILEAPPRIVIDVRRMAVAPATVPVAAALAAPMVEAATVPLAEAATVPLAAAATVPLAEAAAPATKPEAVAAESEAGRDPFAPPQSYQGLVAAQRAALDAPAPRIALPSAAAAAAPQEPAPEPPTAPSARREMAAAAPGHVLSNPPQAAGLPPEIDTALARLRSGLGGFEAGPAILALAALVVAWVLYRRLAARRTRQRALLQEEELALFDDAPRTDPEIALAPTSDGESVQHEPEIRAAIPVTSNAWQAVAIPPAEAPSWDAAAASDAPADAAADADGDAVAQDRSAGAAETAAVLEHRIGRLEARIEELLEARERLERFAAAQSEELRVQRAAIARTQRVLRGIVRPDESAAEGGPVQVAPPID